jgi:hypothetical protein
MQANLYLAYMKCEDLVEYLKIDLCSIIGLDQEILDNCIRNLLELPDLRKRGLIVLPRKIISVNSRNIDNCFSISKYLAVGCLPLDADSARSLAKTRRFASVVMTPKSLRYVDEAQVNFMAQAQVRKYIEIHLHPFVVDILNEVSSVDVEREFYFLGETIERALKKDVGVVIGSASPSLRETLLTTHIDLILFTIGFSKRERRLMLELYPKEFILNWLNQ